MDIQMGSLQDKQRFINSLSRSLCNSIGTNKSFTNPGFLEAYYNFQMSAQMQPETIGTPSRDLAYFAGMEEEFCKDFTCCGIKLQDLHELLQHFEENHVVLESDDMDEDDDLPFTIDNIQDVEMEEYAGNKPGVVALSDIYQSDYASAHHLSAFDNSVLRRSKPAQPWRHTDDSPPQTFPINLDGPTKSTKIDESKESIDSSPTTNNIADQVEERTDRPYKCKIQGCNKSYKNPGGLKYHMHHGHCEDTGDPEMNNIMHKPYQCTVSDCQKRYKNLNGLKYHIEHAHQSLLGV